MLFFDLFKYLGILFVFDLVAGDFVGDFLELISLFQVLELDFVLLVFAHLPMLVFLQFFRQEFVDTRLVLLSLAN